MTPVHAGGPQKGGLQLSSFLQKNTGWVPRMRCTWFPVLTSPISTFGSILHSIDIPLPFLVFPRPYILTIKGNYLEEFTPWQRFYSQATQRADIITVPSLYLKNILSLENALVIPNAINISNYGNHEYSASDSNIHLLIITKFYFPNKAEGVIKLIKILSSLPYHLQTSLYLDILGDGPLREKIQKNLPKSFVKINFHGMKNPCEFLNKADIFVYYSLHDNFPNVILEAMASKKPVITNNVGAVKEIISENCGYVALDDDKYREYLLALILNKSLRIEIGRKARIHVENTFSERKVFSSFIKLYEELAI